MAITDERYFATYCRLDAQSEELTCTVNGDAVAIGIELSFEVEDYVTSRGKDAVRGIVKDVRGEKTLGFLPADCARRVCDLARAGWEVKIAASAVGFTEATRVFWIEAVVFAYEPAYEETLGAFVEGCLTRMGAGERPDVRLSAKQVDAALEDPKFYKSVRATQYPKLPKGDVYYKKQRTTSESMARAGAKGNIGCWAGTLLFYAVVAAIIVGVIWFLFLR